MRNRTRTRIMKSVIVALALALACPATAGAGVPTGDPEARAAARDVDRAVVADRLRATGLSETEIADRLDALDETGLAALAADPDAIAPARGILVPERQRGADTWKAIASCAVVYGAFAAFAWYVVDAVDPTVTRGPDY